MKAMTAPGVRAHLGFVSGHAFMRALNVALRPRLLGAAYLSGSLLQSRRECIQRERTQQVAAHPALDLRKTVGSLHDPFEISRLGELTERRLDVGVADKVGRA